jgi:sec-independent protein translocase protein TatC
MIARPIGHDARLPLLTHLDELRTRLIVSAAALTIAFGFAFWHNHAVLQLLNRPLANTAGGAHEPAHGPLAQSARTQAALRVALNRQRLAFELLAHTATRQPPATRRALTAAAGADAAALAATPNQPDARQPVTLGIAEPFSQTVTVSGYCALLLALPVILYQLYAFVIPALSPTERRIATPLLALAPVLFAAGLTFGDLIVLPSARCSPPARCSKSPSPSSDSTRSAYSAPTNSTTTAATPSSPSPHSHCYYPARTPSPPSSS